MLKKLFVIKSHEGEFSEFYVVHEPAEAHRVGGPYVSAQIVLSEIVLPEECDQLEGLMEIDEVESLILHALDAAYNRGRRDERTRITTRIQRTLVGE